MTEFTTTRSNHLIDPSMHVWGFEVPIYLFLGGLVAGIMVLSGFWALRKPAEQRSRALALLPWASPILISLGMLFLWLDLENGFNAHRFYMVFRPGSPMSWGSWILLGIYPASILMAWALTPSDLRDRWSQWLSAVPGLGRIVNGLGEWSLQRLGGLAWANVLMGVALGIYTGVLLGTMAARPLWNSALLGPLFLVSGLSTGAAYMLLHRLADDERRMLGKLDTGLIITEMVLLTFWMVGLASGGAAAQGALSALWGGAYTTAFWTFVVAIGLVTPLVAGLLEHRHGAVPGRLAAILVLVGGFSLRWILVSAGQYTSWISG